MEFVSDGVYDGINGSKGVLFGGGGVLSGGMECSFVGIEFY